MQLVVAPIDTGYVLLTLKKSANSLMNVKQLCRFIVWQFLQVNELRELQKQENFIIEDAAQAHATSLLGQYV